MFRCSLFCLIFYLGFLILSATMNEIDIRRKIDHSKRPYNHFGRHYEYIYETPSIFDQRPRFRLSYGTIGGDTNTIGDIDTNKQISSAESHRPKKNWQSDVRKHRLENRRNDYTTKFSHNSNNEHDHAWEESESARKHVQKEYEIVRQFADDVFNQAKKELSKLPTFDIPHFQKVFSAVTNEPVLLSDFLFGREANPTLQGQYDRHKIVTNGKQKMKADKEIMENHGKNTVGRWSKNVSRNDASYQMFGILPKFDPRFPFDRAYKLMKGLQPPEMFKFPLTSFHI
ncbi:unnamed protein product [Onchocerca flexuosa]|uniref:Uncharacterized protein n=1 Tax=Onchocerca flexuosa TaxID=387005 RepID=A0A183H042_9BILA|nr:unnamed protein product [Onchocerca flexuosa]